MEFYRTYFSQTPAIPFDYLDKIEQDVEKESNIHLVDMVMNNINEENLLYYIYENSFNKFQEDIPLVEKVVKGLFQKLDGSYSFIKNKAILPYQRIISLGLFCLCRG